MSRFLALIVSLHFLSCSAQNNQYRIDLLASKNSINLIKSFKYTDHIFKIEHENFDNFKTKKFKSTSTQYIQDPNTGIMTSKNFIGKSSEIHSSHSIYLKDPAILKDPKNYKFKVLKDNKEMKIVGFDVLIVGDEVEYYHFSSFEEFDFNLEFVKNLKYVTVDKIQCVLDNDYMEIHSPLLWTIRN